MPLVEAGDEKTSEDGEGCPTKCPLARLRRQGFPPGAEQEETQQCVTDHMPGLPEQVVPGLEVGSVNAEEEMEKRVEDMAGVLSRQVRRGFNGDDDQPEDGGDPRFQEFALMRVQDGRNSVSPCWANRAQPGEPR